MQQGHSSFVEDEGQPLAVNVNDFCIVETKSKPGTLFLAQVTEMQSDQIVVLHLWVINKDKKITPSYIDNTGKEWWRGKIKTGGKRHPGLVVTRFMT